MRKRATVMAAAAFAAAFGFAGTAHAQLISNGSFEDGPCPGSPGTLFFTVPSSITDAAWTLLTGWTRTGGSIDHICVALWDAALGLRSIDMSGGTAGTIEQSFATIAGGEYRVTFSMAGNPAGGLKVKPLKVTAAGTSQQFTFDTTGKSFRNMGWVAKEFVFTAITTNTTLTFESGSFSAFGPTLDNVSASLVLLNVPIDIKPSSDSNSINLGSAGVIPVAIMSSENFDATIDLDQDTISLAGARVKMVGKSNRLLCHEDFVNDDDLLDVVCQVETAQFMIEVGESVAVLEAETFDGVPVRGEDTVRIVP